MSDVWHSLVMGRTKKNSFFCLCCQNVPLHNTKPFWNVHNAGGVHLWLKGGEAGLAGFGRVDLAGGVGVASNIIQTATVCDKGDAMNNFAMNKSSRRRAHTVQRTMAPQGAAMIRDSRRNMNTNK